VLKVRLNIDNLRRKIARAKQELPAEIERALRDLADEAVRLLQSAPPESRRAYIKRQLGRQFSSIFIPVRLKHERKERWPDLAAVYRARIVQGRATFEGRRRVSVDAQKEFALFDSLMRRAMAEPAGKDFFEVRFVRIGNNRARVEIARRGPGKLPVLVAFAKPKLKQAARDAARRSLAKAGF
jgi:hypothetical protein